MTLEAGSVVDSGDDAGAARSAIIRALGAHRDVATLDEVPQHLPTAMLKNFVLSTGASVSASEGTSSSVA